MLFSTSEERTVKAFNIIGILASIGFFAVATSMAGCASKPPPPPPPPCEPPPCQKPGDTCQQECDGSSAFECILQGQGLICALPGPCDETQHCEVVPCFDTTCSFSKRISGEGVYTCDDTVCCKATPSEADDNIPCNDSGGVCDGTGVCK